MVLHEVPASEVIPLSQEEVSISSLHQGDTGESVKEVQKKLVDLGYLTSVPDGDFGPKTEQAVKSFQNAKGIEATGIVDQVTYNRLFDIESPDNSTGSQIPETSDSSTSLLYATVHLNVRSGPGSDTALLGVIPQGTAVQAGPSENGWTQISYMDNIGYVSSKRLTTEAPATPPVVSTAPTPTVSQTSKPNEEAIKENANNLPADDRNDPMVWIPTNGGTKYHSYSDCSGMYNPRKVHESEAKALGFTPCARCKL